MSRRDDNKARTRQLAIDTARRLWAKPGDYSRHGIRVVADAMGMSTGSIFANFDSKEALWCAAFPGQPAPVDSPMTRLAPKMFAMLSRIGQLDHDELILTSLAPELAEQVHRLLGEASMAIELQQAA